jgi:ADP-heptose:LPS heptosyltransferase
MHMAAAVGRPVLAIFGATDPKRTGPYGPRHRVIMAKGLECQPCFSGVCRRKDLDCLLGANPAEVGQAALEMLAKG